jgi:hypothetical protein
MKLDKEQMRDYMRKYNEKRIKCDACDCTINCGGIYNHKKTKKHLDNEIKYNEKQRLEKEKEEELKRLDREDTKEQIQELKELIKILCKEFKPKKK